jgi:hypothetical protein
MRILPVAGAAAGGLFRLHEGLQVGDRLLHHAGALDHLGQEHLALAEQVADDVHAVHQRAFDDLDGALRLLAGLLGVLLDESRDALDQRVLRRFSHRLLAPAQVFLARRAAAVALVRSASPAALGGVVAAVEDHVLDGLAQLLGQSS